MGTISDLHRFRDDDVDVDDAAAIPFVVSLAFDGVARGVAGPFDSESDAQGWVVDLLGDDPGWTATVVPMTAPDALPLAAERRAARRQRLHVVR
jgi:hypothetical protein